MLDASPSSATPTLSSSRFNTNPYTEPANSTSSPAMTPSRPYRRAMPSPVERTLPVSLTSVALSKFWICDLMI
jgi:hypothetical protein